MGFNPRKGQWAEANDIALIRLAKPAKPGPNIIPVCLPSINEDELARDLGVANMREGFKEYKGNVTVAGFGKTRNYQIRPGLQGLEGIAYVATLQYVKLPLLPRCYESKGRGVEI